MSKRSRRNTTTPKNLEKSLNYDLDIVIPVYGNIPLLKKTVDALPDACGNIRYKLTIVDNKSPLSHPSNKQFMAMEFFHDLYDEIKLKTDFFIQHSSNLGFPVACNAGFRRGRADHVLFLNSDCIMNPGSIELLVNKIKSDTSLGIVAPMLLFPTDEEYMQNGFDNFDYIKIRPAGKIQHVGLETNINGNFYHIFIGWDKDNPKVQNIQYPYAVTGAALLTKRSLYQKLGGFWEGYGQGTYEDVDYCLGVRNMGYNIGMELNAIGTHYVGATSFKYNLPMPLQQNQTLFMQRWAEKLEYTEWRYL